MKKILLILSFCFLAITFCLADSPHQLETMYLNYIASLEDIRDRVVAEKDEDDQPATLRIVQLNAKIAATKYCLSALRKEFGLPAPTPSP